MKMFNLYFIVDQYQRLMSIYIFRLINVQSFLRDHSVKIFKEFKSVKKEALSWSAVTRYSRLTCLTSELCRTCDNELHL